MKKVVATAVTMVCMACVSRGELFDNGDFEAGPWPGGGSGSGAAFSWVEMPPSLQVSGGSDGGQFMQFDTSAADYSGAWGWSWSGVWYEGAIAGVAGDQFTVSGMTKNISGGTTLRGFIDFRDEGGNRVDYDGNGTIDNDDRYRPTWPTTDEWAPFSDTFAVPSTDLLGNPFAAPIAAFGVTFSIEWEAAVAGVDELSLVAVTKQITEAAVNPDGSFSLTWDTLIGRSYEVHYTENMVDWNPLVTGYPEGGATETLTTYVDPAPGGEAHQRMYRTAYVPPAAIFFDDMEQGAVGWTQGVNVIPGSLSSTEWELGPPSNVGPSEAYSTNICWGTDLDAMYDESTDIWLRSPTIDLTGETGASLSFYHYLDVDFEPDFHWGEVNVLNTSGAVLVDDLLKIGEPANEGWVRRSITLPPEGVGQEIVLEFRLVTDNIGQYDGWYIDDVTMTPQ